MLKKLINDIQQEWKQAPKKEKKCKLGKTTVSNMSISGKTSVRIDSSGVYVDGKKMDIEADENQEIKIIVKGNLATLECFNAEVHGDIYGDAESHNLSCKNIGGNVESHNVKCSGNISGDVDAHNVSR